MISASEGCEPAVIDSPSSRPMRREDSQGRIILAHEVTYGTQTQLRPAHAFQEERAQLLSQMKATRQALERLSDMIAELPVELDPLGQDYARTLPFTQMLGVTGAFSRTSQELDAWEARRSIARGDE